MWQSVMVYSCLCFLSQQALLFVVKTCQDVFLKTLKILPCSLFISLLVGLPPIYLWITGQSWHVKILVGNVVCKWIYLTSSMLWKTCSKWTLFMSVSDTFIYQLWHGVMVVRMVVMGKWCVGGWFFVVPIGRTNGGKVDDLVLGNGDSSCPFVTWKMKDQLHLYRDK